MELRALGQRKLTLYKTIRYAKIELQELESKERELEKTQPKTLGLLD